MFTKLKSLIEKNIRMSPELWTQIQEYGQFQTVKKNDYLLKAGEVCQHGYFINKGSLAQTFLNQNGKEIVQGFYIDEGFPFLASVSSYFSEQGSNFQIKALEDCEIIVFSKSQLEQMASDFQEFALFYHKITSWGFQNLYVFSAMRLSLSAEEFLLFLFDKYPIYMQRIPDKYIAQFIGVSKEWLSKLKKKVVKNSE